jgi:hypothetical protein
LTFSFQQNRALVPRHFATPATLQFSSGADPDQPQRTLPMLHEDLQNQDPETAEDPRALIDEDNGSCLKAYLLAPDK